MVCARHRILCAAEPVIARLLAALPVDGRGVSAPRDKRLKRLQERAAQRFWRRMPWPARPFAVIAARLLWCIVAMRRSHKLARNMRLGGRAALRMGIDSALAGTSANEAYIWRYVFDAADERVPGSRAMGRILAAIGAPADRRLLTDKLAAAEAMAAAGLPVVPSIVIGRDDDPDGWLPIASTRFVKPRLGSGGHHAFSVERVAKDTFRIDGGEPVARDALRARLACGEVLVQPHLSAAAELAGMAGAGRAPVLRLMIARPRDRAGFIHSALLSIPVPGENPRHFLRGHLYAPIDPSDGLLLAAVRFAEPKVRFERCWWNDAVIAGLPVPGFGQAVSVVLAAADLVPGLALTGWDVIVTPDGPMILEGNSECNWALTSLPGRSGLYVGELSGLLESWDRAAHGPA